MAEQNSNVRYQEVGKAFAATLEKEKKEANS